MNKILLIITLFITISISAQSRDDLYRDAYTKLTEMLEGKRGLSFKQAVYSVENAYLMGTLDSTFFNSQILFLTSLAEQLNESRKLIYTENDRETVSKYASIYAVLKDSIPIVRENKMYKYVPFGYDFEDIFGHEHWQNMFVSKLLETRVGNCHSLPYLYKIIAEEIGAGKETHLALAPNHIYIKHRILKGGWYNTELTSGIFPIDAWLMASGFISVDAISNGVYMKALDDKESIALCLIDLAQGYQKSMFYDNDLVLQCADKALEYYPNYVNAILVKVEAQKVRLENIMAKHYAEFPKDLNKYPESRKLLAEIEIELGTIHNLGYRKMPEEMYLDWLVSLKEEKNKYANKKIHTFIKSK